VRARRVRDQRIELAAGGEPIDPPGGIVHTRLPLVSEVEIAARVEDKIVDAFEALAVTALEERADFAGRDLQRDEPVLVVRDQQLAVAQELHAVRLSVELRDELPASGRIDAENPPVRNVGDVQVAVPVRYRPLEERVGFRAAPVRVRPRRARAATSELLRQ